MNYNFEDIRKNGMLLYEYVRGSKLYGLDRPESDEDHGGVYIESLDDLFGGIIKCPEDVHSIKNDDTWYSLGKYAGLVMNSNPNILESLYVPSDKILYKHPVMDILLNERDKFITKKCFKSFMGYSKKQLERARSLGRKVCQPEQQPEPFVLDSVYTFKDQGSMPIKEWLKERGLEQKYCGLVNVPNMTCNSSVFYDWASHVIVEYGIDTEEKFILEFEKGIKNNNKFWNYVVDFFDEPFRLRETYFHRSSIAHLYNRFKKPLGYHGFVKDTKEKDSKQLRLSSVEKGAEPICYINFDSNAYTQRCIKYKEWKDWMACRNKERYQEVKDGKKYDCKNALHCARLITMGIEIARGEGLKIDRREAGDRDFLMKIRRSEFSYDEIMSWLDEKDKEMVEAMKTSSIPDEPDYQLLNSLIIKMRKEFYGSLGMAR